jgi:hypothetical protein
MNYCRFHNREHFFTPVNEFGCVFKCSECGRYVWWMNGYKKYSNNIYWKGVLKKGVGDSVEEIEEKRKERLLRLVSHIKGGSFVYPLQLHGKVLKS